MNVECTNWEMDGCCILPISISLVRAVEQAIYRFLEPVILLAEWNLHFTCSCVSDLGSKLYFAAPARVSHQHKELRAVILLNVPALLTHGKAVPEQYARIMVEQATGQVTSSGPWRASFKTGQLPEILAQISQFARGLEYPADPPGQSYSQPPSTSRSFP